MTSALANFLADMRANLANHPRGAAKALSHCLTCAESWHGGFVTGPCGWSGCELTAHQRPCAASSRRVAALEGSDLAVSVVELTIPHAAPDSGKGQRDHA